LIRDWTNVSWSFFFFGSLHSAKKQNEMVARRFAAIDSTQMKFLKIF